MNTSTVAEVFRQIQRGDDIPAPASLFKGISQANASKCLPNFPYSIIENLWHVVFWQTIWLDRLQGRRAKSFMDDWQTPPPEQFKPLVAQFLKNESVALKILSGTKFKHMMKSDEIAIKTLIAMAVHDSYHLGQINVIKRSLRLSRGKERRQVVGK